MKKGILGKVLIGVVVLGVAGSVLGGRGEKEPSQPEVKESPAEVQEQAETKTGQVNNSDIVGTWKVTGLESGGNYFTVELLESLGNTNLSDIYLVLYKDMKVDYIQQGNIHSGTWEPEVSKIKVGTIEMPYEDGKLLYASEDETMYFERISETAAISQSLLSAGKTSENTSSPSGSTAPAASSAKPQKDPEPETPAKSDDSISPELKAFLDSYEACMDEYCDFMANYDASDLSQLSRYTELLSKYYDFAAKADEWGNRDMNKAETAYYLEVMNRVNDKLLKVSTSL